MALSEPSIEEITVIDILLFSSRGNCRQQQDAISVNSEVIQANEHLSQRRVNSRALLLGLADGVATSPAAARASTLALSFLSQSLAGSPDDCMDGLMTGRHVRAVQHRLSASLAGNRQSYGASTTIVAVHMVENRLSVLNVGDSRAYLRSVSGEIRQLSRDHTELERLRDEGLLVDGTEYASMYSALSDCLVADPEAVDFRIHRSVAKLQPGDLIVLCSDGIHDVLGNARWMELLGRVETLLDLAERTRQAVLDAGAPDNFSMIVAAMA